VYRARTYNEIYYMRLIVNHGRIHHPSIDTVDELESAIAKSPNVRLLNGRHLFTLILGRILWEFYFRNFWRSNVLNVTGNRLETYFIVLMGPRFNNCLPYFALSASKHIYIFDAWPSSYDQIVKFMAHFRVTNLFVSSRQSAQRLDKLSSSTRVHWIPEGVDPTRYLHKPSNQRRIDVLQLGRKWDYYHERILQPIESAGYVYLFEKVKGQLVFPSRHEFINGLSDTKISICFPSNITHPDRAGGVSTLTTRYLQSMASKCLVVGTPPPELNDLFGYPPIIEADLEDPAGQLKAILSQYEQYADLIEANYEAVCQNHTWERRWQEMRSYID
jgi:glycosyltransferase involved in cell wall biosynthesis